MLDSDTNRFVGAYRYDGYSEETKLIVGHDLITERNIGHPVKITVFSTDQSYVIRRDL